MHIEMIDLIIICFYFLLIFFVGFWISKKSSQNIQSYFLGNKSFSWWMLGFSNSSGMFDVSGAAWMIAMIFIYGVNMYWQQWAWPIWNQIVLMMFLSIWLRKSNVLTGAEWISFRFGNDKGAKYSHLITVVFAVLVCVSFIAYLTVGIGIFAQSILGWNLSQTIMGFTISSNKMYAIIIICLTSIYSIKGGMYSVVATEIIQYFIMIVCCILITYFAVKMVPIQKIYAFFPDGWLDLNIQSKITLNWNNKWDNINKIIDDSGFRSFGFVFSIMALKGIWASIAGPLPSYDMQRILSTKSPKEAAKMNAFTMLVLYFPLYLLVASMLILSIYYFTIPDMTLNGTPNLSALLGMVIDKLPIGLKGLIIAGMLAAFMSTFSAFVNSGPAYIVNDIYKKYINPNASNKKLIKMSYFYSFILILMGVCIGIFAKNVESMFEIITGGLYAGFVIPNALKWIWWRLNGWGYFAGMVCGTLLSILSIIFWKQISNNQHLVMSFPINLFFCLLTSIIVSILTKPTDINVSKHFYKITNCWGFWKPISDEIKKTDLNFKPNQNFLLDMFNVLIGIIWQMSLILMPIYFVLRKFNSAFLFLAIFILISIILKFTWYNKLQK